MLMTLGLGSPEAAFGAISSAVDSAERASLTSASLSRPAQRANFAGETASADAHQVADWVVTADDNQGLPFLIVDKVNAKLFLFDGKGSIRAAAPVLLGLGRGDDSPPGIGDRKLSSMTPAERVTPAGRFVASTGRNLSGQDILWVDYDAAISLHRATDSKPGLTAKSRMDRLTTASTLDNRISHGCINVSVQFYDSFIRSTFEATTGIVYILPETRSVREEFGIPVSGQHAGLQASASPPGP